MRTAASLPSGVTCGVVSDRIEVATPPLSMSSIIFWGDQFDSRTSLRPITSIALSQDGGTTWACTSMRCGFACANTFGAKPVAASPAAAAPATNRRRLMPVAASGSTQHVQTADSGRPFHLSMASSCFPAYAFSRGISRVALPFSIAATSAAERPSFWRSLFWLIAKYG